MKHSGKYFRNAPLFLMTFFFSTVSFIPKGASPVHEKKTIRLTGTRFFFPLIEKWAEEFEKENSDIDVIVQFGISEPDINATGTPIEKENPGRGKYAAVSRFAIVPIINEKNPAWLQLQAKGLSRQDFEKIYFKGAEQQSQFVFGNGQTIPIRVYTRGACASATFSKNFGRGINDLTNLDTKIADDKVLLQNVLNDSLGVAYNNLGFVYDLKTRKQKQGLKVVPVDIDANGKIDSREDFYKDLDTVIQTLEGSQSDLPPVGKMVFIFKENKPEVTAFTNWILTKGQKYNHALGFLTNVQPAVAKTMN